MSGSRKFGGARTCSRLSDVGVACQRNPAFWEIHSCLVSQRLSIPRLTPNPLL
jgi:hypothetical protein